MIPGWKLEDVLPALERRTVKYIARETRGPRPFFLYLPLTSPHYPVVPTALMERYVTAGRSTPGPRQENDVPITWDRRGK